MAEKKGEEIWGIYLDEFSFSFFFDLRGFLCPFVWLLAFTAVLGFVYHPERK